MARYEYLWSGDRLIEEVPVYADGTVAYEEGVSWVYAPGGLTPVARHKKGRLHYVVADHMGTPRELLDEQGKLAWAARLKTWGKAGLWGRAANDEERVSCNLRFAGQYADDESGLHYNRFRYYDADTGQYLCPDPLGLEGGLNLYAYVPNPLNWIDPLGLTKCSPGKDNSAHNAADYQRLKDYYTQHEKYGSGGVRELQNGRYRFYDEIKPSRNPGEMKGARLVREWDPSTGNKRT